MLLVDNKQLNFQADYCVYWKLKWKHVFNSDKNQFYLKFASCLVSQVDLNLYQWIKHAFDEVHLRFNLFFSDNKCLESNRENL